MREVARPITYFAQKSGANVRFPPYAVIQLRILNGSSCPIPVIAENQ
jgi:hypothetical protein